MMNSRWFFSGIFREGTDMRKHVRKLFHTHHDLLSAEATAALDAAQKELKTAIDQRADDATLRKRMDEMEALAQRWLKPYRHPTWQENMEVILVALTIALAVRTFFFQPFKIPTGSMQPTLYGIEHENVDRVPTLPGRFWDACVHGIFYRNSFSSVVAEIAGDHLLVDRLTYNFRAPRRGEIIVFRTKGILHKEMAQDQFYIKRLVGLSDEKISIGDDQHVRIGGVRLDASTPHFEKIYNFPPRPRDSRYFGHINERIARRIRRPGLAPLFQNGQTVNEIPRGRYVVMGDNTLNSSDSRTWGSVPGENVIGKSFFVYWPFSNHGESRFGWSHTN